MLCFSVSLLDYDVAISVELVFVIRIVKVSRHTPLVQLELATPSDLELGGARHLARARGLFVF